MISLVRFLLLFLGNFAFSNYFFGKFQESDVSIAIQGLDNFAEDLSDIGFPANIQISYTFFVLLIAFITTLFIHFKLSKTNILENPVNILKMFFSLFLLNVSTLSVVLYIFRFYNFPRSFLILDILIYPIVFIIFMILLNIDFKNLTETRSGLYFSFMSIFMISLFSFIIVNQFRDPTLKTELSDDSEEISIVENVDIEIPIPSADEIVCYKWSGSSNFRECREATGLTKIKSYPNTQVNNFVTFKSDLYTVLNTGIVMKNNEVYVDITDRVLTIYSESGLYDVAFHPYEDYFIISYSNKQNELTLEKFEIDSTGNIVSNQVIYSKPNKHSNHYCGSIDWSENFNSFLFCVGDMAEENLSLSTDSQNGKILILDNESIMNAPLISSEENRTPLTNFIAYGLRNPWNFKEHKNLLIVPDVGEKSNEELNIVDLNDIKNSTSPVLFGWPIFEGSLEAEESYYGLKMWNTPDVNVSDFVKDNSIGPKVYYDRPAPENNRVAILGTVIFDNPNSIYHEHIFFGDFLSKEIFSYDYENDNLYIINLPYFPGYLTAISNHPDDNSKLLFSTSNNGSSEVYELQLP